MIDIERIINLLDSHIEKNNYDSITPIEANKILQANKLLLDSKNRRGKPLRVLLRKNLIPHAYQPKGKGTAWYIPHSKYK